VQKDVSDKHRDGGWGDTKNGWRRWIAGQNRQDEPCPPPTSPKKIARAGRGTRKGEGAGRGAVKGRK